MNITKTVIKVQASMNYQVASLEAEIENYTEEELQNYSQYLVDNCSKLVKNISNAVGPTHTTNAPASKPVVQTQVQRTPVQNSYQPVQNQAPRQPMYHAPAQGQQVKFASEKQIQYIRGLGYTGDTTGMTFADADRLLKQLKGEI